MAGDKLMPELHLSQPGFTHIVLANHLLNLSYNKLFDQKKGLGASVNEELAQWLRKNVMKNSKEQKCMGGLKIM